MGNARADVAGRVTKLIIELLGVKETDVVETASLTDDLGADSLEVSQMAMMLEEEFDILIPDEWTDRLVTVGDAIDLINDFRPTGAKV
ncbi:acyl carrier protein [Ensifer adhaerens]|uniref:acyl carrier protein n=1 Tax=Ensifer adhaerens TaxID=106592 RepID=UPI00080730BD|nr:acyl carrier protein [Ensifer adhaerens]